MKQVLAVLEQTKNSEALVMRNKSMPSIRNAGCAQAYQLHSTGASIPHSLSSTKKERTLGTMTAKTLCDKFNAPGLQLYATLAGVDGSSTWSAGACMNPRMWDQSRQPAPG